MLVVEIPPVYKSWRSDHHIARILYHLQGKNSVSPISSDQDCTSGVTSFLVSGSKVTSMFESSCIFKEKIEIMCGSSYYHLLYKRYIPACYFFKGRISNRLLKFGFKTLAVHCHCGFINRDTVVLLRMPCNSDCMRACMHAQQNVKGIMHLIIIQELTF